MKLSSEKSITEPWDFRQFRHVQAVLADHLGDVSHEATLSPETGECVVWISEEDPTIRALATRRATTVLRLHAAPRAGWRVMADLNPAD